MLFNFQAAPCVGVGAVTSQALPSQGFGSDAPIPSDEALKPDLLLARSRESEKVVSLQAEMSVLHLHLNIMAALSSGWLCSGTKLQLCLLPASWKPPQR